MVIGGPIGHQSPITSLTRVIQVGDGLALVGFPSAAVARLPGSSLESSTVLAPGRVAGAAPFALGFACWHNRTRKEHKHEEDL
jgi:hypothetical protein